MHVRIACSCAEYRPCVECYFCEECDAIRCPACVSVETANYFCPNCLFEVPAANVRAEKNRCARNCFQCPHCASTLSVVASDPSEPGGNTQPPYFLACPCCKWDSLSVGISFDKPTGLSTQLQKLEDSTPAYTEFDAIKDHFDPFIRASTSSQTATHSHHISAAHSAALSALQSSNLLGAASKYGSLFNLAAKVQKSSSNQSLNSKDEIKDLQSRSSWRQTSSAKKQNSDLKFMRQITSVNEVSSVEQAGTSPWHRSLKAKNLKPTRVPLLARRTKRCPACRHIVIKPDPKSPTIRYKIRLMASNYLPAIDIMRRPPIAIGSRITASAAASSIRKNRPAAQSLLNPKVEDEPLRPGRSYTYELRLTNPLYEPIEIQLAHLNSNQDFSLALPIRAIPVAAFAELWEYEDVDMDSTAAENSAVWRQCNIIERRANTTVLTSELVIAKEAGAGPLTAEVEVTYIYHVEEGDEKDGQKQEEKSFVFSAQLFLGNIVHR